MTEKKPPINALHSQNDMRSSPKIIPSIGRRDVKMREKWRASKIEKTLDQEILSFDTELREERFINAQFITEDEKTRYNQYRDEWYRRIKDHDPGNAPLSVVCELVSTCNLACPMCYSITDAFQNAIKGSERIMPWPIVKKIIDECSELEVPSLHFNWRGESTLYRDRDENGDVITFPDVLAYARKRGILGILTFTNGQLIDQVMAEAIVKADPSVLSISVDGLQETYNKIRQPRKKPHPEYNPFERVMAAIGYLVKARTAEGRTRPQIRVTAVYPAIAADQRAFYNYMYEKGADWVTVNTVSDYRTPDLPDEETHAEWSCQYPFQRLTISSNGIIVPCTSSFKQDEGMVLGRYRGTPARTLYRPDGSVSSMRPQEMTLHEAWHSQILQEIRQAHAAKNGRNIKPGCHDCRRSLLDAGDLKIPRDWSTDSMSWLDA